MAVDWPALTTRLAKILEARHMAALTWTDVTSAVVALSAAEKAGIVLAIQQNQPITVGQTVTRAVGLSLNAAAYTEASAMLSDQTLTPAELDRLFGL